MNHPLRAGMVSNPFKWAGLPPAHPLFRKETSQPNEPLFSRVHTIFIE
jgi:hypothetical protein